MDTLDLLSVVITAHNEEATIKRAILSIINQTYKPIEIIVVNDGSTDSTQQTIEETISDLSSHIILINNKNATGLMAARNTGIANSSGNIIAFLDGDDEWDVRKAEIQINKLKQLPDNSILFTARVVYPVNGLPCIFGKQSISNKVYNFKYNQVLKKEKLFHLGASMMLYKSTFNYLGGFDVHAGKERDLIARVGVIGGTIAWLGYPLYIQHQKANSMSKDIMRTYEREIDMLKLWEPAPNRDPTRDISETEFLDYRKSILHQYRKQLFLERIDNTNITATNEPVNHIQKIELYSYRLAKPLHTFAKYCFGIIRYMWYRIYKAHDIYSENRTAE